MGSQCSALRRGKLKDKEFYEPKIKNNEVEEQFPLSEESGAIESTSEEENFKRQEEENPVRRRNIQIKITSPNCSETNDPAEVSLEEKEANYVDNNSARLIQEVTSVMAIADELKDRNAISKEMHAKIRAASTSMDKMRELIFALNTTKAKSLFYRILQDLEPQAFEKENISEFIEKHKKHLREHLKFESEGTDKNWKDVKSLDEIYTELHIIQGESGRVNEEHEIWEIEDKTRSQATEGAKINCNDIFKSTLEDDVSEQDRSKAGLIRTVMTKGIAGIGKTVSVKKFILDWADGKANHDLDFIFFLPFRELNLVLERKFSLVTLVKEFHEELKGVRVARIFANNKILFIFDGLDESQLQLDFKNATRLTNVTEESSVDVLVTNLVRGHLLRSALLWITSRPGAVQRIPRRNVHQWTEVRGFNDPQKIQYFRNRIRDKEVAEKVIGYITMSRSLYIMCHIPIFCWIAAKVFEHLLPTKGDIQKENIKIPTTVTEMYTYFLITQIQVATEKYSNLNEPDTEEIFKANEEFIFKLGRMAFECLTERKLIFTADDLKKYGINTDTARVHCGLCTEVFKEESVFKQQKLYCFVHLTIQEYFAALFVYQTFANKKVDCPVLKDFMLEGSDEELKSLLEKDPVDLPLNELIEITMANASQRETGELDMFLRFLVGMSLQSTQELLQGLVRQTDDYSETVEGITESLLTLDLGDCSPERCLNLVHCLIELKDGSLHDTVQQYITSNPSPDTQLSPIQCSALADSILISNTPLAEFNLKKYRPSAKGIFRLLPAVRNCRKARISGVQLDRWLSDTIASALRMPNSALTELHLVNISMWGQSSNILAKALMDSQSELEVLSLSGEKRSQEESEELASAVKSIISNLRELELSSNIVQWRSLCSVLSDALCQPKLEKLRLNQNYGIKSICEELVRAFTSNQCQLRELQLSFNDFEDSHMEILSAGLKSMQYILEVLSLSHNKLTDKGCETLALALSTPLRLREVDLSYNDLYDAGVMALSKALMEPHCALKTLRLSFCRVTVDGCASLASALRSDRCGLRELDLSFNHLTDQGIGLLTEIQRDSRYSLEKLNVDQNKEYWFDFQLLRKFACDLTLDSSTVGHNIILLEENKEAEYVSGQQPYPPHPDRFVHNQVICEEALTDCHYWEVECHKIDVGVTYKSIDRVHDYSSETSFGKNEKSWCWFSEGSFRHNNSCLNFLDQDKPYQSTIGVFLDWPAGILSFFRVTPDTMVHLYTTCTTFTEPLYPAFILEHGSTFKILPAQKTILS
ncbi:NLR family CARD domain-containing protein 3-like isoform X2 [Echeneis naucrates]|uniref:NLR family CARD domain-containing protein 3-like isoform X2 n=1 Tax=Echeneis naucrates TaxID=173247 RepID=UPI001113EB59|nr:NLR family CARD domain-containing protein 3-like isoform X2 [Echeneis naucrates]